MSFAVVGRRVAGFTCLDDKLYVVHKSSHRIHVLMADTLSEVSVITVDGLQDPTDIVACRDDHQLYVIEWGRSTSDVGSSIWRVSAANPSDCEKWFTDDAIKAFCTLSLTSRRLLVTLQWCDSLRQYSTTNRQLLRVIEFPHSTKRLTHAAETTRGTFVVVWQAAPSVVRELFSFFRFSAFLHPWLGFDDLQFGFNKLQGWSLLGCYCGV